MNKTAMQIVYDEFESCLDKEDFLAWLANSKPELLIKENSKILQWLEYWRNKIPQDAIHELYEIINQAYKPK